MLFDQIRADIQIAETLDGLAVDTDNTLRNVSLAPSGWFASVRSVQVGVDTEVIDVFTDNLVRTDSVPPEGTVGEGRNGLDDGSGDGG